MNHLIEQSEINYHLPNNPEAQACLNKLCRLIAEECIQAVKDADETHAHTTFDKGMIGGTKQRCVTSIKERLSL
jgi:uncharacterized protein (UPF0261 family)